MRGASSAASTPQPTLGKSPAKLWISTPARCGAGCQRGEDFTIDINNLNGRTEIPLKKWRAERGKLTAEKSVLTRKYATLKEEVRDVETVRKYAEEINRAIVPQMKSRSDLNR
jgi:hypothetical protein